MPNRPRWDGRTREFAEVWYVMLNDLATGDGFWIRYTLLNPLDSHPEAGAALWFAYTCRAQPARSLAIRRVFAGSALRLEHSPPRFVLPGAELGDGYLRGCFEAEGHTVEWDLAFPPSAEPHYFLGPLLRRLAAGRGALTIPSPQTAFSGEVRIDGERHRLLEAPGHQAHHWGRRRAERWLWGHCCHFAGDRRAVVELLAADGPGGVPLAFVALHSERYTLRCLGVNGLGRHRAEAGLGFWRFVGVRRGTWVVADMVCDPERVLSFTYHSPTYRRSRCWNTATADCLVRLYTRRPRRGVTPTLVLAARGVGAAELHDALPEATPYGASGLWGPRWWPRTRNTGRLPQQ